MRNTAVKRPVIILFICIFLLSAVLSGCGNASQNGNQNTTTQATTAPPEQMTNTPLSIDIFNNAANYQGEQTGWFGQIVKEKFNLTLNILSPQVAGDALYKTRTAAGNLGDLLIVDNSQMEELIPAGLVADMTDMIKDYPNLSKYLDNHFKPFNATFESVNPEGKIYGFPTFEADTSPTTFSEELPYSSPIMPWDYYKGVGAPKLNNLNDLLDVLKQMRDKYPTNADGKPTIPITLWKDWDGNWMENARWLCNWYGYELPDGTSSILLNAKGEIAPLAEDNSQYHKILKFFFDANQRGLVDPDSAAQDWNKVAEKLTNKQVLLLWYTWQRGFYNTIERGRKGDGNVAIPIADTRIMQTGDAYYGNGRVWALGSKAKDSQRVMEFMDWYCSPEGIRYHVSGIEGFNYEKTPDGKFRLTETGMTAFQNNTPVPAEYGGGGYQDGQSKINSMIISDFAIDPDTGEFYNQNYWSSTLEANKTVLTNEWIDKFQADNATDYYIKNKMIDIVPNINTSFGVDSSDIKNKRSQTKDLVVNTSWQMVFAKNEAEFNQLWTKMKSDLVGLGWNDIFAADTARAKKLAQLRADAMK